MQTDSELEELQRQLDEAKAKREAEIQAQVNERMQALDTLTQPVEMQPSVLEE